MKRIENYEELKKLHELFSNKIKNAPCRILICAGTGCQAGGSAKIADRFHELAGDSQDISIEFAPEAAGHPVGVRRTGCHGFCEMGPLVRIEPQGILYTKVKPEDCDEIFEKTVKNGELIHRLIYKMDGTEYVKQEEIPFYAGQTRVVLKNCGHIDAEHIEEAIASGTYLALAQ